MHCTVRIIETRLVFQRISFGAKRNISVKRDVWNTYRDSLITKHVFRFIVSAGKWFFGSDSASYGREIRMQTPPFPIASSLQMQATCKTKIATALLISLNTATKNDFLFAVQTTLLQTTCYQVIFILSFGDSCRQISVTCSIIISIRNPVYPFLYH